MCDAGVRLLVGRARRGDGTEGDPGTDLHPERTHMDTIVPRQMESVSPVARHAAHQDRSHSGWNGLSLSPALDNILMLTEGDCRGGRRVSPFQMRHEDESFMKPEKNELYFILSVFCFDN